MVESGHGHLPQGFSDQDVSLDLPGTRNVPARRISGAANTRGARPSARPKYRAALVLLPEYVFLEAGDLRSTRNRIEGAGEISNEIICVLYSDR